MRVKSCTMCKLVVPLKLFTLDNRTSDSLSSVCIVCQNKVKAKMKQEWKEEE